MPDLTLRACGTLLISATLAATAASCSSDRPTPPPTSPPASSSPADAPVVGVLTFANDDSAGRGVLTVHDPVTGKATRTLTVPGILPHSTDGRRRAADIRSRFTADWSMVTWASDGTVFVADRQGDAYVVRASWKPQETFERGPLPYRSPTFNPRTGRIWFREGSDNAGKSRVMSVDPLTPTTPPRQEQASPSDELQFDHTGRLGTPATLPLIGAFDSTSKAKIIRTEAGVLSAQVHVSQGWNGIDYTCQAQPHWKTTASLPCYTERQDGPFGAIAVLTINQKTNTAKLQQAVPRAADVVSQVVFSPDARRARVQLRGGRWYVTTMDNAGAPQPANLDGDEGTAVAWTVGTPAQTT